MTTYNENTGIPRPANESLLRGWLVDARSPFTDQIYVPYAGRSIVLTGPNGHGKTRLMNSIVDPQTPRVLAKIPKRLAAYAAYQRAWVEGSVSDSLSSMSIAALADCGETWREGDDDEVWWQDNLGSPDVQWVVKYEGPAKFGHLIPTAGDPLNLHSPIPVAPQHIETVIERWTTLDADHANELSSLTLSAFRKWTDYVFESAGLRMKLYGNALVASDELEHAISLLPLARAYASILGARASTRLELLCGFVVSLRCSSENDFSWSAEIGGTKLPLNALSRAMSRWAGLAAYETLRELTRSALDAATLQLTASTENLLKGEIPSEIIPAGAPQPFSTRTTWIAMDEPEIHLFASEARLLGQTLAKQARAGRTMVVTHSLDLAARLVGECDFLTFSAPGSFECTDLPSGIESLLKSLAQHGAGILSITRVLYVEGDWDIEILRRLFQVELNRNNTLLSPVHGVDGAHLAVTSVWHRMMGTPFGVMFDSLTSEYATRKWSTVNKTVHLHGRAYTLHQLRREIREKQGEQREVVGLLRLFYAVIDGGIERRLKLVMHGMSDIFQVVHPQVFGIDAENWQEAGFAEHSNFKDFVHTKVGINLKEGHNCRLVVDAFDNMGHPVDQTAFDRLFGRLQEFFDAKIEN